jgi:hypothetical protein
VVIDDFHFIGVSVFPDEAQPVLVVDADGMLAFPVPAKYFERIADSAKIVQTLSGMQLEQLPQRYLFDAPEFANPLAIEELFRIGTSKGANHHLSYIGKR